MRKMLTLKGVEVEVWRQSVKIVSVAGLIGIIVHHLGSVDNSCFARNVDVVQRHGHIIMAIAPKISYLFKAINQLVPSFVQEVALHSLLVILLQQDFKVLGFNKIRWLVILLIIFQIEWLNIELLLENRVSALL